MQHHMYPAVPFFNSRWANRSRQPPERGSEAYVGWAQFAALRQDCDCHVLTRGEQREKILRWTPRFSR